MKNQDWKVAAIYRLARKRHMRQDCVIALLIERAGLATTKARQLVSIWRQSNYYNYIGGGFFSAELM